MDQWVADVLTKSRAARVAAEAAAVASAAAQERDAEVLKELWPAWWDGLGSALDVVGGAVDPDTGRPLFRRFADGRRCSVISLARDPSRGWIRFSPDADPPGALHVTWRVPGGLAEQDAWRRVVVDGSALTVGGASDPTAFVRSVVETWLAALGALC